MMILGGIMLVISWLFIIFGVIAIFVFRNLYMRIIASTIIDTVASIVVILAAIVLMFEIGFIFRLILLILFLILTSPISTHVNIRSAYLSKLPLHHDEEKRK
ncbi:MAG: monovalent cation/H(+) antiporter subunit G [Firmicutes bacterium]|nr:monovalent cation/H(+) antiporter subunit G [Bacillota bacterium]